MFIVTGDFNAHLDQSVIEYSYHNTCNSNGRLVKNLFKGTNLSLQMEGSRRGLGSSGHYFAYEWYENKGRLHRGQEKMKELCTRLSFKANEETAKEVLPKRKKDRKTKASDDSRMVKVQKNICRFPLTDTIGVQLRITERRWRDKRANCLSSIILQ